MMMLMMITLILWATHDLHSLQHVSDKYRPTGSDQQEDLTTLGSVQLRQTLALWTLASQLTTAWRKATTQHEWRHIVDTATLQWSTLLKNMLQVYCKWMVYECIVIICYLYCKCIVNMNVSWMCLECIMRYCECVMSVLWIYCECVMSVLWMYCEFIVNV